MNKLHSAKPAANTNLVILALAAISLAAVATLMSGATRVEAAAFTVTNLNDAGPGSLRQSILDANAKTGPDTIGVVAGLSGTLILTSGQLTISDDLTLIGPGENVLAVSGNHSSRVFEISQLVNVSISDL